MIWNDQLIKLLVSQSCQLIFKLFRFVKIYFQKCSVPVSKVEQHISVVESKTNIGNLTLFGSQSLFNQCLL